MIEGRRHSSHYPVTSVGCTSTLHSWPALGQQQRRLVNKVHSPTGLRQVWVLREPPGAASSGDGCHAPDCDAALYSRDQARQALAIIKVVVSLL